MHFEEYNEGINRWFDVHATPLKDNKFSAVFTDITDRKKTEEALKSNQELFKKTFDSVSFAVSIVRVSDNQIVDINEAYLQMVEYHKEEVVGHTAKELQVFPNHEEREKIARLVHEGSQVLNQEIDVRTKSGKILRALFSVDLINFDNQPHFLGSLINITDRKKAEEKTHMILESIAESYFEFDNEWRYVDVNLKSQEILGLKKNELIGKVTWELFPQLIGSKQYKEFHKAKKENIPVQFETKSVATGEWFETNAYPHPEGLSAYSHNINDRKKAEIELVQSNQKISEIIESIQDNFYVLDYDWNYVHINKQSAEVLGMETKDFIGQNHWKMFPQYRGTVLEDNFREAMEKREVRQFEIHSPYNDNWFIVTVYPSEEGITVLGTNITERKKIEEDLQTTMDELTQSNKELEQFAYITSHDLREPLRMITSFLQLLERRYKDQLDQDANEFIDFAVNGAKRLDAMTNALLQYSKITKEKREVIPVNFEHVLKHALTNLKLQIEENNAIITHDPLPTIIGDEELKVQLFQNIIANSIKYKGQETPKIHISSTKEKNQYLFSIKDNGIGISNKHLKRIFTIFQRLHTHDEYEGTGIGLAIAQKIVHQQDGQIWVESELGKGSTFYFTIPT